MNPRPTAPVRSGRPARLQAVAVNVRAPPLPARRVGEIRGQPSTCFSCHHVPRWGETQSNSVPRSNAARHHFRPGRTRQSGARSTSQVLSFCEPQGEKTGGGRRHTAPNSKSADAPGIQAELHGPTDASFSFQNVGEWTQIAPERPKNRRVVSNGSIELRQRVFNVAMSLCTNGRERSQKRHNRKCLFAWVAWRVRYRLTIRKNGAAWLG